MGATVSGSIKGNNIFGSINFDNNTLFIDSVNHRIGVKTITPDVEFDVDGSMALGDNGELYNRGAGSRKPFRLWSSTDKGVITLERDGVDTVNISTDSTVGGNTYFNGSSVDVGIGTTTIQASKLVVSADSASPDLSSTNPSGTTLFLANSDTQYGTYFATTTSGVGYIQQRRYNAATFYDIALQPYGGNVSIGSTSADDKLDIAGAIRITSNSSFLSGAGPRLYRDSALGLALQGYAGSTHNLAIFTPTGIRLIENPIGGDNVLINASGTGNMGVHGTAANYPLEVTGGATDYAIATTSTDAGSYITFKDSTTASYGVVGVGAIGDDLSFRSGNAVTGTLTSAGVLSVADLTLTGLSTDGSETTALLINGSNQVVTRELGSNAFTSTGFLTTSDIDDTPVNGVTTDAISSNWAYDHAVGETINLHTKVGTITTGVWNGTALTAAYVPNHDSLTGFVVNEHINHSNVSISAGNGLTGGGDLTTTRTLTLGTPSTITQSSTNSATSTSHTHALTLNTGISDNYLVTIDSTTVADNEYARFTANGLESRSYAEVKSDLSLNNVENTALTTWTGSSTITTIGTLVSGSIPWSLITGAPGTDNYVSWTAKDGDTTTYPITSSDQLTFAEGTGMDVNFTADDVLTFTNTDRGSTAVTTHESTYNHANFLNTSTSFGGDVSGTYNTIVVANDSHSHSNYITSNANDDFSGTLTYTPDTGVVLKFDTRTAIQRHTANGGMSIGADDCLVLGAGEARATVVSNITTSTEIAYLAGDNGVNIITSPDNWGSGYAGRNQWTFSLGGDLTAPGNITSTNLTLTGLVNHSSEATALMINGSNVVGYRELGSLAFSNATYDNYQNWRFKADGAASGDNTIVAGDTLNFISGSGIINTPSDNALTISVDYVTTNNIIGEASTLDSPVDGDYILYLDADDNTVKKANITSLPFSTTTGDINGVTAGNGLTGGGSSGTVTINVGAGTGIDVAADTVSVDVSDFMTNGSNNRIVTATGTDAMNAEANLTFDGSTLDVTGDVDVSGETTTEAIIITDSSGTPKFKIQYNATDDSLETIKL